MKIKLFSFLIVMLLITSPSVAQKRGTDVGGGGNGTDEKYHPHSHPDHRQDNHDKLDGHPWPELVEWCTATRAILEDYKYYAKLVRGNYKAVRETLVKGLQIALEKYRSPNTEVPFELLTLRSITRALALNDVLSEADNEFENQVVSTLLSHFYNLIIEVNIKFDQNYTLPFLDHTHHCQWHPQCDRCRPHHPCNSHQNENSCRYNGFHDDNFYAEFGKYVVKLLSFSLDRMQAMGSNHFELLLFENITGWAAQDLSESIFRRRYECVQAALWNLNQLIHNFLSGRKGYFPDSRTLILHIRNRVTEIKVDLTEIEYGTHTHGNCHPHETRR